MAIKDIDLIEEEASGDMMAVALTDAVYELPRTFVTSLRDTVAVLVQAQNSDIYYTTDGQDPDPSSNPPLGLLLYAGAEEKRIPITNVNRMPRFYRTAADSVLQIVPVRPQRYGVS